MTKGCVIVSYGYMWTKRERCLVWGLLGACGVGWTDRVRKTQHEEAGSAPLDAQGLKVLPGSFLGSWEIQGPSDEPMESTTTIHV